METLQRTANRGSISTGYDIDNSLKFEADNTESLTRSAQDGGNRKITTISFWTKRTELTSSYEMLLMAGVNDSKYTSLGWGTSNEINFHYYNGGSYPYNFTTQRLFRDTSAWYHIVIGIDTTQATDTNRVKFYVNGEQIANSDLGTNVYPSQDIDTPFNNDSATYPMEIGNDSVFSIGGIAYSGYITEFNFIDGSQLTPTSFGEFDEDSGIWKPKKYTGSYGTNGFYLDFESSGSLGADSSGNGNDFSLTNITSADQATDTPTNNFTTWNTIRRYNQGTTLIKDGGTVVENNYSGGFSAVNNNIRVGKGKWYAEFEVLESGNYLMNGNVDADYIDESLNGDFYLGSLSNKKAGAGYYSSGTTGNDAIYYEGTYTSSGVTTSAGDVISVAMDCDNNKVHFAVNGAYTNSSNPATNTNGFAMTDAEQYFALASIGDKDFKCNFGGYTADTISSAASDANGYGTFEYAPPSGYYALCTKNLAEYG